MEQMHKPESNRVGTSLSISHKFYKRSLTVVGHYLVGVVMICLGLATVALVLSILTTLFN